MPEKLFELRKDVSTPDRYIRAGAKKTEAEWRKEFPNIIGNFFNPEWFIDLSPEDDELPPLVSRIVDDVFDKHGLHSITYKQAAIIACLKYHLSVAKITSATTV